MAPLSSLLGVASLALVHHAVGLVITEKAVGRDLPTAFDGPYITNPSAGKGNNAVEWWWFQALAPEVNGIIPSFEAIFYEGFAFSRAETDPDYRVDVSGVFPNGTTFFVSMPVTDVPTIETKGQAVYGNWGDKGIFSLSEDRSSLSLTFNNPEQGLTGTVDFKNLGTPPHGPCDETAPYFSTLAYGKNLNDNEKVLYEQTGWAITMPRAATVVDIVVQGSHLSLNNAIGYHDHNWAPIPLDKYAYTWLTGQGSCGPFDLTYLEVQALASPRSHDILKGFVAYNGKYLQNECSLYGDNKAMDTINITLTGETTDPNTQQSIPTGMVLDYTLRNGTHYVFNLHNSVQNPSQIPYHRWRLGGTGGIVGGQQYECQLIGDWLNPGLATYSQGGNIFETQHIGSN
ncbi:hypothetical protein THAR02_11001 [Trichoderma harzianum]|uniref:AttH domain-containing protein n=1 Tax=Trichoderma harzianum TaxID=5544 RepID=A0A0F9X7V0_TRIHA|nr:hypothetical protein THAR02_11001 [Trichoderma harzianum]